LFCVGVNPGTSDVTDMMVASVLDLPFHLSGLAEAEAMERSRRLDAEGLFTLRRIHLCQPYPVAPFLGIDNRQGVAIHDANHRAGESFGPNAMSQEEKGSQ
jgi:hypothetical protein